MSRLPAAVACDVRLQYRNGFYAAAAFVAVVLVVLLRWLPPETLRLLLPALVLANMQVNTFYFVAGLVLLEKAEGSLEALVVTPAAARGIPRLEGPDAGPPVAGRGAGDRRGLVRGSASTPGPSPPASP